MSGFGHYSRTVAEIVKEIAVCCFLLEWDWTDAAQTRTLVDEFLRCTSEQRLSMLRSPNEQTKARGKIFALLTLLLNLTRQAAQAGVRITSGSRLWQALEQAFTEACA